MQTNHMPSIHPSLNSNVTLIDLQDVCKKFETGAVPFMALKQINLNIQRYEFVAILGKSGSGKSTLLNLIG